ncbi:MAG: hypothetical protein RQ751_05320 [Longimicrobiales bacterium]|nr:hypothetical protein [Longimicrobiales bacterium]
MGAIFFVLAATLLWAESSWTRPRAECVELGTATAEMASIRSAPPAKSSRL